MYVEKKDFSKLFQRPASKTVFPILERGISVVYFVEERTNHVFKPLSFAYEAEDPSLSVIIENSSRSGWRFDIPVTHEGQFVILRWEAGKKEPHIWSSVPLGAEVRIPGETVRLEGISSFWPSPTATSSPNPRYALSHYGKDANAPQEDTSIRDALLLGHTMQKSENTKTSTMTRMFPPQQPETRLQETTVNDTIETSYMTPMRRLVRQQNAEEKKSSPSALLQNTSPFSTPNTPTRTVRFAQSPSNLAKPFLESQPDENTNSQIPFSIPIHAPSSASSSLENKSDFKNRDVDTTEPLLEQRKTRSKSAPKQKIAAERSTTKTPAERVLDRWQTSLNKASNTFSSPTTLIVRELARRRRLRLGSRKRLRSPDSVDSEE